MAIVMRLGIITIAGASQKYALRTCAGVKSSFRNALTASAAGWSRPKMPTRFGPSLSWMEAETFRSTQTAYATINIITEKTHRIFTALNSVNCASGVRLLIHAIGDSVSISHRYSHSCITEVTPGQPIESGNFFRHLVK